MELERRLKKLKEMAENAGVSFQPALLPRTISERVGRWELTLPSEINALFAFCDGAELDISVCLMPLSSYIDVRRMLIDIAGEMESEEWRREYHPFAHLNGDLTLCLELPSRKVRVLDIECSVTNDVAQSLEDFLDALEAALSNGGVTEGEYGNAFLPGWQKAAEARGIGKVWNSGIDDAKSLRISRA